MNPQIRHAQRACEAAKARQAVVVWFDEAGQFAVASYGETKAECTAVKPVCNAIHEAIHEGILPCPGDHLADHYRSKRALEMESLQDERAAWQQRAEAAEKQLAAVAMLVSIYDRQDEPEGQVSARRGQMKSHIPRNDESYFCGETSITAYVADTCTKCLRGVDVMRQLLKDASWAIRQELMAAGEDEVKQHPTYRANVRLLKKIDRVLGVEPPVQKEPQ